MPNEQGPKPVAHTKKHVARLERERQQTKLIMYIFVGILVAVAVLLLYGYLDVNVFQLRKPIAKVGDVEISVADFESRVRLQRQQFLSQYQQYVEYEQFLGLDTSQQRQQVQFYLDSPNLIGQTIVDQLVDEEIIRQEAAKLGITVSPEELEEAIQAEFGYYPNGSPTPTATVELTTLEPPAEAFDVVTKTPLTSPTPVSTSTPESTPTVLPDVTGTVESTATLEPTATSTATLAPTSTPTTGPTTTATPTATAYTLDGYQGQYATTVADFGKFGMSDEGYRKLVENRLLREKLAEAVIKDVKTTEEQAWARHILVGDPALAITIIGRLNQGEDFAELAKEFSTDTGSGVNGGDLGWFGSGAMVPEFEAAAFALEKPGDITQTPVQSQFGYHVIQLIAKQERPLSAEAIAKAEDEAFVGWLATVRETYTVEIDETLWKARDPKEPNFITLATESVETAIAAQTATFEAEPTVTPKK